MSYRGRFFEVVYRRFEAIRERRIIFDDEPLLKPKARREAGLWV